MLEAMAKIVVVPWMTNRAIKGLEEVWGHNGGL